MKFWLVTLAALLFFTQSQSGFAFESESEPFGYYEPSHGETHLGSNNHQSDATRVQKFEAALETLGIPLEPTPDFSNFIHANEVNQSEVQQNLPYLDPDQGLSRYLSIVNGNLQLFRDFFKSMISLDYLEYQQTLSTNNPSNDSFELMQRLRTVAAQSNSSLPLAGLKVLIDPGHMGGNYWDGETGKFVSVNGRTVSEGDLNLWTALLTARKLEALGAIVKLTREKAGAVSTENPKTFDITPYLNHYFYNSMDDWMAPYLEKPINEVRTSIKNASEVKKAYSATQRMQFFVIGADLEARSQMIDAFKPDITLDIHYDANKSDQLQNTIQNLEAFVPGSFRKNETSGRKVRSMALKHLLETRRWNQSVELADRITQSMSTGLQIPRLTTKEAFTGTYIRDGVYARNLYITRRALSGLVVYLECLRYDHEEEFDQFSILDQTSFQNSNRLNAVADSIRDGFLEYFKNLKI